MGVKQLWTLLGPVGRPVLLETMEGKTMAIDSSIWIYQFQATMRDKEGRALVNAHVLGFLRRICKLLFYGIRPVFVFDGGAPVLKRITIAERKRKKAGAADNHVRVAEKLLAAQLRREAINQVQKTRSAASAPIIDQDTVYLEDLVNNTPQASRLKGKAKLKTSPESATKKSKFHDHDPYRLPQVDLESITKPTSSDAPDPRLATEEELRIFIESMRPEDFDVNSPAFRDLPTEVKYEIIGDLRLKSRQTSHKRLQAMLNNSKTPLDFSKAQIRNLQQRNALTQQLLETTDSISKANVMIPVRIASERNKEYVLMKNEGDEGGWILGIQNEGTQEKPIVLDEDSMRKFEDEESDDAEMEEVSAIKLPAPDPDLREYQSRMALAAVARRQPPVPKPIPSSGSSRLPKPSEIKQKLLFIDEDADLESAIQESLKEQEEESLRRAIEASTQEASRSTVAQTIGTTQDEDEDLYEPGPSRLATALSFANTPNRRTYSDSLSPSKTSMFGTPTLLLPEKSQTVSPPGTGELQFENGSEADEDMEEVEVPVPNMPPLTPQENVPALALSMHLSDNVSDEDLYQDVPVSSTRSPTLLLTETSTVAADKSQLNFSTPLELKDSTSKSDTAPLSSSTSVLVGQPETAAQSDATEMPDSAITRPSLGSTLVIRKVPPRIFIDTPVSPVITHAALENEEESVMDDWELPSTPMDESSQTPQGLQKPIDEAWDAAQEMDVIAEEQGFVQFLSQMKGQDLDAARKEIDNEILDLNRQKKAAMRDSEDINQHMISQIMLMLRLFGIPYITAPMEAEAQCATLVSLGLVEGVITDDSDVFLFGGLRVFKNMFNQSKTVECFLLSDLARELGLDRDKLIRLAHLLGSDYVDGLPGVGPVVAMEILKEFPSEDGLHKFKEWWRKVQSGKDTDADSQSAFRKRFKKRFKELYLLEDWPNPAVRDAYYHPAVDESEEPFKWGLPDLDGLRQFLHDELSWSQSKVDDLLVPIIRKMGQRNQNATANRQGVLDTYLEVSTGGGVFAPRRRQAYASKRLQKVVADFRATQKNAQVSTSTTDVDAEDASPVNKRKAGTSAKGGRVRKRGRGGKAACTVKKRKTTESSSSSSEDNYEDSVTSTTRKESVPATEPTRHFRPRPKPTYKSIEQTAGEEEAQHG